MGMLILLANLGLAGYLTGLIWVVQVVHYPLFAEVGAEQFERYHALHMRQIGLIVAAPMLAELGLSVALIAVHPVPMPIWLCGTCAALTALIWLATFALSVPLHDALTSRGYDRRSIDRLVGTNWIRTACWSARLALLAYGLWLVVP